MRNLSDIKNEKIKEIPIIVNNEFRGIAMISGLPHLEDHRNLVEVMDQFCTQKNA